MANPLDKLKRHNADALGPCAKCGKVILETAMPLFYRITIEQCGVDADAVRQHAGLAMTLSGGADGMALASIMGAHKDPVVVMGAGMTNLCMICSQGEVPFFALLACTTMENDRD